MIAKNRIAAEVFPPGDYIREELEARHWRQSDLAAVLGRPLPAINEMINGKKRITAETAKALALAFGTSAEVWLNLETAYRLSLAKDPDPKIARRAKELMHG
jgi:HTH-type transcriptional regulator / antitoxin HigA